MREILLSAKEQKKGKDGKRVRKCDEEKERNEKREGGG